MSRTPEQTPRSDTRTAGKSGHGLASNRADCPRQTSCGTTSRSRTPSGTTWAVRAAAGRRRRPRRPLRFQKEVSSGRKTRLGLSHSPSLLHSRQAASRRARPRGERAADADAPRRFRRAFYRSGQPRHSLATQCAAASATKRRVRRGLRERRRRGPGARRDPFSRRRGTRPPAAGERTGGRARPRKERAPAHPTPSAGRDGDGGEARAQGEDQGV